MLSWPVLIDRGFNHNLINLMNTISKFSENYFSIYFLGNNSEWGTPVPIPNTEVKPLNADDSEC